MIPHIPWPITLLIVAATAAIPFVVWRVFAARASRRVSIGVAVFVFGWFASSLLLAPAPASVLQRDPFSLTLLIPFFGVTSFAITAGALLLSRQVRDAVAAASLPAITAIQLYRVLGAVFVVLYGLGQLPGHFALPAGWGDIFIGITAPLVALGLSRRVRGARAVALAWNAFGLLDLAVAFGMGTGILAPYLAPELGAQVPPAAGMGVFPLILIPTFAVPMSLILHGIAVARLLGGVHRLAHRPRPVTAL
jgi:hypothetical protein